MERLSIAPIERIPSPKKENYMFEFAELGQSLSKEEYKAIVPSLRNQLLQAQFAMQSSSSPIIIIIEGVDNVVKGEVVNRLNEWFDTRGLEVFAFAKKTQEEAERPKFWRYWQSLPFRGRIALFSGSWYTGSLIHSAFGELSSEAFDAHMNRITAFEKMLTEDGAVIIKFWLHMSKNYHDKSFKEFKKSHEYRFKISETDFRLHSLHNEYTDAAKRAVTLTQEKNAPWVIVESEDQRYRDITVAKTILTTLSETLAHVKQDDPQKDSKQEGSKITSTLKQQDNILSQLDLTKDLKKSEYKKKLAHYQKEINELCWQAFHQKKSIIIVLEGSDAAGKGGVIRRIMQSIDARVSRVISIAAPTDEELSHHYLWRFWRYIPKSGHITIYDRSWYGRVLVERVEGFASDNEWQRAYNEINRFEEQLSEQNKGILLFKFWLQIDKDEQLKRFQERETIPYKNHKITDEDWRNRERWDDYQLAIHDMLTKTSTKHAPWTLVPSNSKRYARVHIIESICNILKKELNSDE
jgi:polyphosphate:AMP phosphotransferase